MATASAVAYNGPLTFQALSGSFTLDIGSILTEANEDQTVTVEGARVGDLVIINPSAALLDGTIIANPHVSAADTITFTVENNSGSTRDNASATFYYMVLRGITGPYA